MTETQMTAYDFGRALLGRGDLDPVYVLVYGAGLGNEALRKWLLAYFCFYHVGTASWAADRADYWEAMLTAAGSKEWPRSSERRHFRGKAALASVTYLKGRGLDALFDDLLSAGPKAADVTAAVKGWTGFGPWISFKVADMLERLGLRPVEFDFDTVLYDSPRRAAEELWKDECGTGESYEKPPEDVGEWALRRVLEELNPTPAPPRAERLLNSQEAETVLCKWKSYRGGHYEVGEDVAACKSGLLRFANCRTAQSLLISGRRAGLW